MVTLCVECISIFCLSASHKRIACQFMRNAEKKLRKSQ